MALSTLLFTSNDGTTLFVTDGTPSGTTELSNGSSTPAFLADPIYSSVSATLAGQVVYFIMADSTDTTSAVWSYDGTAVTQITLSSSYVYNQQDPDTTVSADPIFYYNSTVVFSEATLASNTAGDGNNDTTTLAVYDPLTQLTTQPVTPHGAYNPHDFVTLNGTLYFEALDTTTNRQAIYSYDGTTVTELYNLHPTFTFDLGGGPQTVAAAGSVTGSLIAFNNHIYFGSGQETVEELTGTTSLSNAATNVGGSAQYNYNDFPGEDLIVANNKLFFSSK